MPYVPSKKTDGVSEDREILDREVEAVAQKAASEIKKNPDIIRAYEKVFLKISYALTTLLSGNSAVRASLKEASGIAEVKAAATIYKVSERYGYEGAFLGEFNYFCTRFIQRVPGIKVENKEWEKEFRYWVYAYTVEALKIASLEAQKARIGLGGVLEDVKDEYKRRVNTSYEAEQILKSGDCYDTPYYTRLVEVADEDGKHIGYQEVMLKRSDDTVGEDILYGKIVLRKK